MGRGNPIRKMGRVKSGSRGADVIVETITIPRRMGEMAMLSPVKKLISTISTERVMAIQTALSYIFLRSENTLL